jgi:hypothetical protein
MFMYMHVWKRKLNLIFFLFWVFLTVPLTYIDVLISIVAPGNKTTQKASSPIDIFKRESSNKAEKLTAWLLACTHTHTHTDTSSLAHTLPGGGGYTAHTKNTRSNLREGIGGQRWDFLT